MAKGRITVNLEYWALRGVCGLLSLVPYACAMKTADALGLLAVRVFGFKRARTLGRIRSVFPGIDDAKALSIAVRSLQSFLRTVFELVRSPEFDREWMDRHVVDGRRYQAVLQKLVDEGRGVVIMVPHSGNWYMAAWAMASYGTSLFSIAARQRNPKIEAWMRERYGSVEILDRDRRDTLGRIKAGLREGRAFAILPDLRVRRRDVEADFLGGKANVSHAGAMFAVRTGAPIVVAAMSRANGRHVFHLLKALRPEGRDAEDLTREAMKLLSDHVLAHPEDWYWYNKRWVLEPVTE